MSSKKDKLRKQAKKKESCLKTDHSCLIALVLSANQLLGALKVAWGHHYDSAAMSELRVFERIFNEVCNYLYKKKDK